MKYLVNELQYKKLKEVSISRGDVYEKEIYEPIIQMLLDKMGMKNLIGKIKNILETHFDLKAKKVKNFEEKIESFINSLLSDTLTIKGKKLDFVSDPDTISKILYILFKDQRGMKSYGRLNFFVDKSSSHTDFFFFAEEYYIGFIKTSEIEDPDLSKKLPSNSRKVVLSALEPMMKGMGFGRDMYLAVINHVGVLLSDSYLFEESLSIWLYALPKYVKFVGMFIENKDKAVSIETYDDYSDSEIESFVASNKRDIIKSIT
jgi:hypothetical protein